MPDQLVDAHCHILKGEGLGLHSLIVHGCIGDAALGGGVECVVGANRPFSLDGGVCGVIAVQQINRVVGVIPAHSRAADGGAGGAFGSGSTFAEGVVEVDRIAADIHLVGVIVAHLIAVQINLEVLVDEGTGIHAAVLGGDDLDLHLVLHALFEGVGGKDEVVLAVEPRDLLHGVELGVGGSDGGVGVLAVLRGIQIVEQHGRNFLSLTGEGVGDLLIRHPIKSGFYKSGRISVDRSRNL